MLVSSFPNSKENFLNIPLLPIRLSKSSEIKVTKNVGKCLRFSVIFSAKTCIFKISLCIHFLSDPPPLQQAET